ncbi:MAG: hypothetical protein LV477_04175 [Candidatus Nitrosotalea sp.]|nr:hypothetical protein [Candidatus Nitrosotalea sp.]
MKTLHLTIITIVAIVSLVIVSTYIIFNPIIHPPSVDIVGFVRSNQSQSQNQTNQTSIPTSISKIIIPDGSADPNSGKNYEPRYLIAVLGANNTVQWTNDDKTEANTIVAENHDDPLFWNATHSIHGGMLLPGKSFNFTFTNIGEFQYDTEPHPWLYGWVLVLPQSAENATNVVSLNTSSTIPGPCEVFRLPCPNNPNFTAQKLGANIYTEKVTVNGVDHYAVIHNSRVCVYPPSVSESCTNPDDLAILRLVRVDTSIPQENLDITINGLNSTYVIGDPVNFGINVKGYGHCDFPSVLVIRDGVIVWQGKTTWTSCPSTMSQIDDKYTMGDLGGPFYLNQSGTYTVHVGYASNMTEKRFDVTQYPKTSLYDTGVTPMYINVANTNFTINYDVIGNGKILDAKMDTPSKSLVLSLKAPSNGTLTVTLPRAMIDAKLPTGNDDKFYVLVNGQESIFQEINATTIDRTISIPFTNGTHMIEIIGAQMI